MAHIRFSPASDGEDSIVSKLLGLEYDSDVQALKYIELSIKYVVDWENGNSVYIRINSDGYPGSGVWTLVSKMDMESDAASYFIPEQSGGALVLKTGGKQNAYVDNIIVWRGTGEEPADKTVMLADVYKSECTGHLIEGKGDSCTDPQRCVYCEEVLLSAPHDYEIVGNDKRCKVCGVLENNLDSTSWFLLNVPQYKGGVYSKKAYLCGQGIENDSFAYDDESPMMIVSETDRDEFLTYCDSLSAEYGYEKAYELERDGNVYAQFSYKDSLIYTYFTEAVSEVRIIDDRNSDCVTNDFGYTYQKTETDTTVLYQIGLPMNSMGADISNSSEKKINCGMMYAIKLADDSVIVIDGGGQQQFDEAQCDFLMSFLREITGTKEGEQVRVSAWYITHGHSDHMAGFCVFSKKYHTEIQLERIMFNFASVYSSDSTQADAISNYNKLLDYIDTYYSDDDVKFVKMHTGQTFNIADVSINIIYTHEDLVDPKTAKTEVAEDYNNGSTVAYFVIDGKKFMLTGDINRVGAKVLMEFNSAETLKSDVLQCAHHCLNYLSEMYDLTQAPCVLMPQSPAGCIANSTRKAILEYLKKYAADENIFYASVGTYGFSFTDEGYEQVYFADCVGGEYTGWGW